MAAPICELAYSDQIWDHGYACRCYTRGTLHCFTLLLARGCFLLHGTVHALLYVNPYKTDLISEAIRDVEQSSGTPVTQICDLSRIHREITPTVLSGLRFHAPLHNFTPPLVRHAPLAPTAASSARWRHLMQLC